jgi:hypothetical protein
LKKSLSDYSVARDRAEIPRNRTKTLQKQGGFSCRMGPENGPKEFFNTLERFWDLPIELFSKARRFNRPRRLGE